MLPRPAIAALLVLVSSCALESGPEPIEPMVGDDPLSLGHADVDGQTIPAVLVLFWAAEQEEIPEDLAVDALLAADVVHSVRPLIPRAREFDVRVSEPKLAPVVSYLRARGELARGDALEARVWLEGLPERSWPHGAAATALARMAGEVPVVDADELRALRGRPNPALLLAEGADQAAPAAVLDWVNQDPDVLAWRAEGEALGALHSSETVVWSPTMLDLRQRAERAHEHDANRVVSASLDALSEALHR